MALDWISQAQYVYRSLGLVKMVLTFRNSRYVENFLSHVRLSDF